MTAQRILLINGPTSSAIPALAFAEFGLSTDQNFVIAGTGTNNPHLIQTTHTTIEMDYSATPGVIQNRYKAVELSTPTAPAYQTNRKTAQPSGICEPTDGDVGIVVKGVLIGRFTSTGLQLSGALTYTGQGGVILSFGTTAQRPASPSHGFVWHNTTLNYVEMWNGTAWVQVGGGGGGTGLSPWTVVTANYNIQAGERIIANTDGGAFTITLPAAPNTGDEVEILGDFSVRPVTIARNGKQIARLSQDYTPNKDNIGIKLVYDNTIGSWRTKP